MTSTIVNALNHQFSTAFLSQNNIISLENHAIDFQQSIQAKVSLPTVIEEAKERILLQWPKLTSDLFLTAHMHKLGAIYNDISMQREFSPAWVLSILQKWDPSFVRPIDLYMDTDKDGNLVYCSYNGQHTALSLYCIATLVYGVDPMDVDIPVTIHPSRDLGLIRNVFISMGTDEGSKRLTDYDIWQQRVRAVRANNSTVEKDLNSEKIQTLLEKYKLAAVAPKSTLKNTAGVISRPQEFVLYGINQNRHDVLENVFRMHNVNCINKPVIDKELLCLGNFFSKYTANKGRKITDEYITDLADICETVFGSDWALDGEFGKATRTAFKNRQKKIGEKVTKSPDIGPDRGADFIYQMLEQSNFSHELPDYDVKHVYAKGDVV